jgi:hypothetical protein
MSEQPKAFDSNDRHLTHVKTELHNFKVSVEASIYLEDENAQQYVWTVRDFKRDLTPIGTKRGKLK